MNINIKDLRERCQKKREGREPLLSRKLFRPFTIYLTIILVKLRCTPNIATFIGLSIALTACIIIGLFSFPYRIIGGLLLLVYYPFDCCDGELVRYYGYKGRLVGPLLEILCHHVVNTALFAALGFAAYHDSGLALAFLYAFLSSLFIALFMIIFKLFHFRPDYLERVLTIGSGAKLQEWNEIRLKKPIIRLLFWFSFLEENPALLIIIFVGIIVDKVVFLNMFFGIVIPLHALALGIVTALSLRNIELNKQTNELCS